jgi:predicted Zn-dependent protease
LAACGPNVFEPVRPARPGELEPEVASLLDVHIGRVAADPGSSEAHGVLGLAYEANGLWGEAREAFDHAAALDPTRPSWPHHAAVATLELGDVSGAVARLRALHADHPGFAPGLFRLADVLLDSGEREEAESLFREALRLVPGTPVVLVGLARALLERRAYEEAVTHLELALRFDPENRMAHSLLATAYRGLGRPDEARRAAARGVGASRRHLADAADERLPALVAGVAPRLSLARDLRQRGELEEALELLEDTRANRPDDVFVLHDLALTLIRMNRPADAREVLEHALAVDAEDARLHVKLGESWIASGEPARALDPANRAIELAPDRGPAYFLKGRALMFLANWGEAYLALKEASQRDGNPQIDLTLAEACTRLALPAEAEAALAEAAVQLPDFLPVHLDLATLRAGAGDLDGAHAALREAEAIDANDPRVRALRRELEGDGS